MSQPIIGDELRIRMELLLQPSRLRFGKSPGPPACFDSADTLSAPIPGCITSAASVFVSSTARTFAVHSSSSAATRSAGVPFDVRIDTFEKNCKIDESGVGLRL